MPAGVIVVFSHLMKAKRQIIVGSHPFGGIDNAGLHRSIEFAAGNIHRLPPSTGNHVATQTRDTHF